MLAVAALAGAGALAFAPAAAANPVCVNDPTLDPVYSGCTWIYIDENGVCVTGGGEIAGRRYQFAPC